MFLILFYIYIPRWTHLESQFTVHSVEFFPSYTKNVIAPELSECWILGPRGEEREERGC